MKRTIKIISAIVVTLCVALSIFGIFFQVNNYWKFPLTDDGHNAGDVIGTFVYMAVYILSLASAAIALLLLLVKR